MKKILVVMSGGRSFHTMPIVIDDNVTLIRVGLASTDQSQQIEIDVSGDQKFFEIDLPHLERVSADIKKERLIEPAKDLEPLQVKKNKNNRPFYDGLFNVGGKKYKRKKY